MFFHKFFKLCVIWLGLAFACLSSITLLLDTETIALSPPPPLLPLSRGSCFDKEDLLPCKPSQKAPACPPALAPWHRAGCRGRGTVHLLGFKPLQDRDSDASSGHPRLGESIKPRSANWDGGGVGTEVQGQPLPAQHVTLGAGAFPHALTASSPRRPRSEHLYLSVPSHMPNH